MRHVRKRALAEADLIDIWQYTFEQWDETQADNYLDELDKGISQLANNPEIGVKRDNIREGYRVLFISRHAVYYTVTPTAIHIIRVLHAQMDPERHF